MKNIYINIIFLATVGLVSCNSVKPFQNYTYKDYYGKVRGEYQIGGNALLLQAFNEAPLQVRRKKVKECYRLTVRHTFNSPICIRFEELIDGTTQMTVKEQVCMGGYGTGPVIINYTKSIPKEKWLQLKKQLEDIGFWQNTTEGLSGLDGTYLEIEGFKDGKYHLVSRWAHTDYGDIAHVKFCTDLLLYSGIYQERQKNYYREFYYPINEFRMYLDNYHKKKYFKRLKNKIEKGMKFDINLDYRGTSIFSRAIKIEDQRLFNLLLEKAPAEQFKINAAYGVLTALCEGYEYKQAPDRYYNVIKTLLEKGVSPNPKIEAGTYCSLFNLHWFKRTPLANAAESGNLKLVKLLLSYDAKPDSVYWPGIRDNCSALFWALAGQSRGKDMTKEKQKKHTEIIKLLLKNGATLDSPESSGEYAFLMPLAANAEQVEILLDQGIEVNVFSKWGYSVWDLADKYPAVMKLLLDRGYKPISEEKRKAMKEAARLKYDPEAGMESYVPTPQDKFWQAVYNDVKSEKVFEKYIKHIDLNKPEPYTGRTPIFRLIGEPNDAAIKVMMKHGADVNVLDNTNYTPLLFAYRNLRYTSLKKHPKLYAKAQECIKILKKGGATIPEDLRLHAMFTLNDVEGFKKLLKEGADPNKGMLGGYPLIHRAIFEAANPQKHNFEYLDLLLAHPGIDLNKRDVLGDTPLLLAQAQRIFSKKMNDYIVKLIKQGADINAMDWFGNTTLTMCFNRGRSDMIGFLLDHGADPYAVNHYGENLFDFAKRTRDKEILEKLKELGKKQK